MYKYKYIYINMSSECTLKQLQLGLAEVAHGRQWRRQFARGISAKVQSLWDLIESQSTALVVRKQELGAL